MSNVLGIHHITAISGNAQTNLSFYSQVLGLRFVKKTVNFDDPATYHLYYGDDNGNPGSVLTFFPWAHAPRGRSGNGQVNIIAFAVPQGSLDYWQQRLNEFNVDFKGVDKRFSERFITFNDPDGITLEIVESAENKARRTGGIIPPEYAISGFFSATLQLADLTGSIKTLELLGYKVLSHKDNNYVRMAIDGGGPSRYIDLVYASWANNASMGVGSVHHIAYRAENDAAQKELSQKLLENGYRVTDVKDRTYFRSIYFSDPAGVICEIATDAPGFTVDEKQEELGTSLRLPQWLEEQRKEIEARLPNLEVPENA